MTDTFDPARWLIAWKEAGGGWAGIHLLPLAGDPAALNALARELDDERRAALGEYLTNGGSLARAREVATKMGLAKSFHGGRGCPSVATHISTPPAPVCKDRA